MPIHQAKLFGRCSNPAGVVASIGFGLWRTGSDGDWAGCQAPRSDDESIEILLTARIVADIAGAVGVDPDGPTDEVVIGTATLSQCQVGAVVDTIKAAPLPVADVQVWTRRPHFAELPSDQEPQHGRHV